MALNLIVIEGRVTQDIEVRTTTSGLSVASFSVAVDRNHTKAGEEKQTDFFTVTAWRQSADFVAKYFKKGSPILVTGSLQSREYEDKEGNKRKAFEIVADQINFPLTNKNDGSGNATAPAKKEKVETTTDTFIEENDDDELPF